MNFLWQLPTAIVLLFSFVATASGGMVFATRQSVPRSWAIFRAPDGQLCDSPCVFGVIPGKTSLAEAEHFLTRHRYTRALVLQNHTDGHRRFVSPDDTLVVTLRMDDTEAEAQIITWISAGFETKMLTYGDSLALLGEPELVRFAARDGGGFLSLRYASDDDRGSDVDLVISSYQRTSHFYPTQPVGGIELYSEPIERRLNNRFDFVQFIVNEFPFWQGFGSILRYVVHPECRRPGRGTSRVCHL